MNDTMTNRNHIAEYAQTTKARVVFDPRTKNYRVQVANAKGQYRTVDIQATPGRASEIAKLYAE